MEALSDFLIPFWPALLALGILITGRSFAESRAAGQPGGPPVSWRPWIYLALAILLVHYAVWRVTATMPKADGLAVVWPWIFLLFEIFNLLMTLIGYLTLSRKTDRTPEVEANLPRTYAEPARVALIIPTYNEPLTVLERSILAALGQDLPSTRVYVLDDGRRDWLRDYCAEVGAGYIRRDDNVGHKAGNMNHGLAKMRADGFEPEFVAVLDADFIATPAFVRRCLALHFAHPDVGIVQTPQHFFNPDPLQMNLLLAGKAPDEQRFFFEDQMASRDAWGTAFCCGTSSLIRMSALESVGGFPTESVTEDKLLSLNMRERGWRTIYLNEPLTAGLAPEGLDEYIVQRHRWCLGFIQIVRKLYNPLSSRHGLNFINRLHLVDALLYWATSFPFRYLCMLAPALYWLAGLRVIDASIQDMLVHLGPWLFAHIAATAWTSNGRLQPIVNDAAQLLLAPASVHATLTGFFSNKKHPFRVTPKGQTTKGIRVNWRAMRGPAVLMALNLMALALAAAPLLRPSLDSEPRLVNLIWIIINVIILAVTVFTCVELPRLRAQERFSAKASASLVTGAEAVSAVNLLDISLDGCRILLPAGHGLRHLSMGTTARLRFAPDEEYNGTVVRLADYSHGREAGIRFDHPGPRTKQRLIRRIHGAEAARLNHSSSSLAVMGTLMRRLVGQ